MQYPRIYHPEELSINKTVQLSDNAARHIGLVLRLSLGDRIILFNGDGDEYLAEIENLQKKKIIINIIEKNTINRESVLSLHLGQAISRSEKMDWVIQKAVELGVNDITPVITQYTSAKASPAKLEHWRKIILSACEQCGRNKMPVLHTPLSLSVWIQQTNIHCGVICEPDASMPLAKLAVSPDKPVHILIGPEGGFSREEITLARQYHWQPVRLGKPILRTETAAIAVISALQTLWGDFGEN
jgi:16S rRNA (uracil1498-N3)-methyltransferase